MILRKVFEQRPILFVGFVLFLQHTYAGRSTQTNNKIPEISQDLIYSNSTQSDHRNESDKSEVNQYYPRSYHSKSTIRPNSNQTKKNNRLLAIERRRDLDTSVQNDTRVPFWNIAHMINSIEQIEPTLRNGANGIETDISFDARGVPVEAYHGFPCDCGRHCHFREDFIKFVQHIATISTPPAETRLLLILFDLKLKDLNSSQKELAGRLLASILNEHLYKKYLQINRRTREDPFVQPPIRVIISMNHATDSILARSFLKFMIDNRLDFMMKQVGFDVGMNDNLTDITTMWDSMKGATFNIWQGDGLTNCANIIRGVDRLKEAIAIRNGQGHFKKVYYWTVDIMYHIRSVLRLGLDAVLTNQPQRVVQVLEEPEFKDKYRLATPYDDPFSQFWIQPSAWKMSAPTLGEAIETVTNIQKTSADFVRNLPNGISAAFKKVHSTIISTIR